jgi:hypothetical protein
MFLHLQKPNEFPPEVDYLMHKLIITSLVWRPCRLFFALNFMISTVRPSQPPAHRESIATLNPVDQVASN